MSAVSVSSALLSLADEVRVCTHCPLSTTRTCAVPGEGADIVRGIVIIGEAPGAEEDKAGRPFIGRSGQLLRNTLESVGISADTVFISNVVKCRPPQNRPPSPLEVARCRPYLDTQLALLRPLLLITLGRHSLERFFPKSKITQVHGQPLPYLALQTTIYPVFHPAAALRDPSRKAAFTADIARIPQLLTALQRTTAPEKAGHLCE